MKAGELLNDPSFRNWANETNEVDCRKWERHLDAHPDEADFLLTTKIMAAGHSFTAEKPDVAETEKAWTSALERVRFYEKSRSRRRFMAYATVAASLVLLIAVGFVLSRNSDQGVTWVTLQTAPGQIMEYQLSDGTTVVLNGNSELQYPTVFDLRDTREVKLTGEAFFQVSNHGEQAPFKVSTKDAQVVVLGTVFNIKSRSKNSVISLLEGKVEVTSLAHRNHIILTPGQSAAMRQGEITVYKDNVESSASWRNQLWVFEETPLRDVLTDLEESFGVAATIAPNVDTSKAISGKLSTKNLSTLYHALETMLGITIIEKGTNILIKNKAE